ncbi:UPF0481 protein [Gossypium australe]|uniref:UPF0481 protein n=1 Tax=Gossypium australe TaxID=47621 RepID=A0A5B6VGT0_9ROSI|nr:UPF0481 protein [Gossypium australe]
MRVFSKIRGCYDKLYYRIWDDSSNRPRQYKRSSAESDPLLLIRTILVDAGFILELLLRAYSKEWRVENDLIFAKSGTIHDLKRDLMLLERQLPFFLLGDMYELAFAGYPNYPTFFILLVTSLAIITTKAYPLMMFCHQTIPILSNKDPS